MQKKGWIALDIDGTITLDRYSIPQEVTNFLRKLEQEGWNIAVATGRPFAFAALALKEFDFPYFFFAQNGSLGLEMPAKKLLFKRYISSSRIALFEEAYEGIDSDFLIYSGYEKGDFCYWRPQRLSPEDTHYLEDLQKRQKESWQSVGSFVNLPIEQFPLVKCFGPEVRMKKIAERLRAEKQFQVAMIRDPFTDFYLLLVTDQSASKGSALQEIFRLKGRGQRVIAAGDDENDLSLLQVADIKIAMAHAPEILQQEADLIAPPTKELGIIHALQIALRKSL